MSSAQPQFTDLTTIPTQSQVLDEEVLPQLSAQSGGLQVTSWVLGGVYRSIAMLVAYLRVQTRTFIAYFTAAGFEDYIFGRTAAPNGMDVTGWAAMTAQQRYGLKQKSATYTLRNILLTNSSSTPYNNIQAGTALVIQFPSTNRYVLNQTVSIPANGSVTAQFSSAQPMAQGLTYNSDPSGYASLQLVTANYPGVVASNPAPVYSTIGQSGAGVGGLTLTGTPSGNHQVVVDITATGNAGTGSVGWSVSLDGGTFQTQTGTSLTNLGGYGINIALTDNSGSPAFIVGTTYYFSTPGTDITQVGAALETPQALGLRVTGMWPLLPSQYDANGNYVPPSSPTQAAYVALALSSNPNVVSAFVQNDATINNLIHLNVAGQGGAPLPSTVLAAVQSFFSGLNMVCDRISVGTPTAQPVTLGLSTGAIQASAALLSTAQTALQQRLAAYFGGTDAACALGMNGLIDYEYVYSLIRTTTGVKHVPAGALVITVAAVGYTTDVQLPIVNPIEVAQFTQSVITAFPWQAS